MCVLRHGCDEILKFTLDFRKSAYRLNFDGIGKTRGNVSQNEWNAYEM